MKRLTILIAAVLWRCISFGHVYYLASYASIYDSISDQSILMQNALDASAGDTLYVHPATFSGKNLLFREGTTILGIGTDNVGTLKTHSSAVITNRLVYIHNVGNITIKNITLSGNIGVVPGDRESGVALLSINGNSANENSTIARNILVENVLFRDNGWVAMFVSSSENITIQNSRFINVDVAVIANERVDTININHNYITGGTSEAVALWGREANEWIGGVRSYVLHANVNNNKVENKEVGLSARYAIGPKFISDTVTNVTAGGCIYASKLGSQSVFDTYISGALVDRCVLSNSLYGIDAQWFNSVFSNNVITNITFDGIRLYGKRDTVISNRVTNASRFGFHPVSLDSSLVQGNIITDTRLPRIMQNAIKIETSNRNLSLNQNGLGGTTGERISVDVPSTNISSTNNFFYGVMKARSRPRIVQ